MKYLMSAIAIVASLFFLQGCSSFLSSSTKEQHQGHTIEDDRTSADSSNSHQGHSMEEKNNRENSTQTQAKLVTSTKIIASKPVSLTIDIQDSAGKAITKFDTFQEKLMHLIVVNDDLQFFSHLHPQYQNNGRFTVEANFPRSGNYTIFSDYKPTGEEEQVSVLKTQVPGNSSSSESIDLNRTKIFGDTKVNLTSSSPTVRAGEEVTMVFDLKQAKDDRAIADLQPYLGEKGHLVILKQSSPLTREDYIHAHAMKDTPNDRVSFMTNFPQPGKYKLWGQFNRNGKIVVADFWVDVL
jgi:hypothetical protein